MTFKDILVHLDNSERDEACLRHGLAFAAEYGAHLTGLYIDNRIEFPIYAEVNIPQSVFDQAREVEQQNLNSARARFERLTAGADHVEWCQREGHTAAVLVESLGCYDFSIVGQCGPGRPNDWDESIASHVVLASGRPMVIVPSTSVEAAAPRNIIVAWKTSKEAARAVHDALPVLERADVVRVLAAKTAPDQDIPCADIAKHLARHGVKVEIEQSSEDIVDVGVWLQSRVEATGAELLVMGAYGHSRYREMIFGGVTRHMLRNLTVPCMMSH